jgi:muconolactone delta-isomerase
MSRRPDSDEPASDEPGHNGELRGLPPEWGTIVVPDDLRDLADEVARIQAEIAAARPASRLRRRWSWRRAGRLSGPLLALILFLVAAIGSLMVVVLPKPARPPRREPLASPSVAAGVAGGLAPAIRLAGDDNQSAALRQFRPAVFLLSPASCKTCAAVRNQMVLAADETQLVVVWITESKKAITVPAGTKAGQIISLADPSGSTRKAVPGSSATGPTAVLIRNDGLISTVLPDIANPSELRPQLAALTVH